MTDSLHPHLGSTKALSLARYSCLSSSNSPWPSLMRFMGSFQRHSSYCPTREENSAWAHTYIGHCDQPETAYASLYAVSGRSWCRSATSIAPALLVQWGGLYTWKVLWCRPCPTHTLLLELQQQRNFCRWKKGDPSFYPRPLNSRGVVGGLSILSAFFFAPSALRARSLLTHSLTRSCRLFCLVFPRDSSRHSGRTHTFKLAFLQTIYANKTDWLYCMV